MGRNFFLAAHTFFWFFIPILWHNPLLFRICVFVSKQCNFSSLRWFTATKDVSFVSLVHCTIRIFLRISGSLWQRNFPSSRWLTATKEFSFVAVVHCNEGTFSYRSGLPWHNRPERESHIWCAHVWIHTS